MIARPAWLDWPETRTLVAAFPQGALRFVGGSVRDTLLSRKVRDVDAATPLPPDRVMALLEAAGIRAAPTGIEHGTVTAVVDKKPFEITTLRRDVATDGRHAQVAFTGDWKEDAARRDFTMNALYLSPEGELFDYFGGETDAREGRVRFIGNAAQRIREDRLRALRFFRFYAWYGATAPDAEALSACAAAAPELPQLSGERLRQEMLKLLAAPAPYAALSVMQKAGVLAYAMGVTIADLKPVSAIEEIEELTKQPPDALVRLALLLLKAKQAPDLALSRLGQSWKLPNDISGALEELVTHAPQVASPLAAPAQKKLLRRLGAASLKRLALLRWALGADAATTHAMILLAASWQPPVFPVSGEDLKALGVPEGRRLGQMLRQLEDEWEAGDYAPGREELLKTAAKMRGG